jgi:hypothetical protein
MSRALDAITGSSLWKVSVASLYASTRPLGISEASPASDGSNPGTVLPVDSIAKVTVNDADSPGLSVLETPMTAPMPPSTSMSFTV